MSTTGPLTITLNQEARYRHLPIHDAATRTHTIESLEIDWQGTHYRIDRDEIGPRGFFMRQSRSETEPGVQRIEVTVREHRPAGQGEAPLERFLFRLSDFVKMPSAANVHTWSHAELVGYETVDVDHDPAAALARANDSMLQ